MESRHDETLARVRAWVASQDELSIDADHLVTLAGDPPITVEVSVAGSDLVLTHRSDGPPADLDRVEQVRTALAGSGDDTDVSVDDDGARHASITRRIPQATLGRRTFLGGVYAIAGLVEAAGLVSMPASASDTHPTRVLERAWAPSHVVPKGGLPAWPTPDGTNPAPVRLEERVELAVAERRGDWARVIGENGWSGWVDGRRLAATRERSSPDEQAGPEPRGIADRIRALPLVGLFVLGVGSVLPWLDTVDGSLSALEVPLAFLWNVEAAEPPALAWMLLLLAAMTAVLGFTGAVPLLFIPVGLAVLAVPLLFIVQVYRGVVDAGDPASNTFHLIGLAPLVVLVAGFLLLAAARRR